MAATGRLVWIPADVKGLRIKGWENKIKNMPEEATSDFATVCVYILDDIDPGVGAGSQANAAQLKHAQFCNNMRDTFTDTVADCTVKSIRMQNGQRSGHLLGLIEAELQNKSKDDLVVFCFHGTAGGDGDDYTFNLTGPGPNRVNAHKLITKANKFSADCLFILDVNFFPTKSIKKWKRKEHMTEIIVSGTQMHDVNGRPRSGPESFDEGFSRAMRDILAHPRGEARQTIPGIMGRDTSLCSKPIRYWLNKPDRSHPNCRVWRFFFDIGRLNVRGGYMLQMRRCKVTGRTVGEFGRDPDLDNNGWGSYGDNDDDNDDDEDEDGDDDDGNGHGAGFQGSEDQDDGDDSNGRRGQGFRLPYRRARRRENADDEDSGNNGSGGSVGKQWATLSNTLGLPSNMSDAEAVYLFKRLQQAKQRERSDRHGQFQLQQPSSGGVRKNSRDKRPISGNAGQRRRSGIATRTRGESPVISGCEIVSSQRVGDDLESPINLSEAVETIESVDSAGTKVSVNSWLQNVIPKPSQASVLKDDEHEVSIRRSESPAFHFGQLPLSRSTRAARRARRAPSMESDLEITSTCLAPGHGGFIDLTGTPIDLTGDFEYVDPKQKMFQRHDADISSSLFIPESLAGYRGKERRGIEHEDQSSDLFSFH